MCQRKIWKVEEDQILKELYENRGVKQWSQIAKIMEKQYGIPSRNGKQCRERYHNHLKGGISKEKWTLEEQNLLIHLHTLYGNRWALISKLIPGRSQNCVKNMLYSRMRRSIRLLNRFVFTKYRKLLKEIKINFIYRLIDFTQKSYKKTEELRNQQEAISIRLKNNLLLLDYSDNTPITEQQEYSIKQLIQDIHTFKRVNQRYRGNTAPKKIQHTHEPKTNHFHSQIDQEDSIKEDKPTPSVYCVPQDLRIFQQDEITLEKHLSLALREDNSVIHPQLLRVRGWDHLDSNMPFLQKLQSNLQQQIPLDLVLTRTCWGDPNDGQGVMENELNDWQAYFAGFN